MMQHLLFSVDRVMCALPIEKTRIVLRMVQLIPPGNNQYSLAGMVNVHGEILPVYSVRSLFGLASRPPLLTDKLVVADAGGKSIALWVDEARVIQQNPVLRPNPVILEKGQEIVTGISLTEDNMFVITDLL